MQEQNCSCPNIMRCTSEENSHRLDVLKERNQDVWLRVEHHSGGVNGATSFLTLSCAEYGSSDWSGGRAACSIYSKSLKDI